jgi:pyrroloquinoline quinone biosynthesis protein B
MQIIILGSAAGGGFPQWNCACANCVRARAGDPAAQPRSQVGVAVSGDGEHYALIGASPDLRGQILATPALTPRGPRDTPISDVLLLNGDIDGMAGLLHLREQSPFRLTAPPEVLAVLEQNSVFKVLDPARVTRRALNPGVAADLSPGLTVTLLTLPGKIPLYQESQGVAFAEPAPVYAAMIENLAGKCCIIAPACAAITDDVLHNLEKADLLLFDGALFSDDEMVAAGVGQKTSRRMGHVPVGGADGSLARLARLRAEKIYIHINNTNPMLITGSPEHKDVCEAGFLVGWDGMTRQL